MKLFIIFIGLFLSIVGFGQQNAKTKPITEWQPIAFLDSVKINWEQLHFDPDKIADINVEALYYDSANQLHGKILITSKDRKNYKFGTIPDITNNYKKDTKSPTIFMVDKELINVS